MSRLFPDRLLISLSPSEISSARLRGRFGKGLPDEKAIPCDPAFGAESWQGAVAALASLRFDSPRRATVVLSNQFVRYAVVPWSDGLDTPAEEEAYVRHHFAKVYGERARDWELRASEGAGGAPRLASAVDRRLIDAIKAVFPKGGKAKLVSVQPQLMSRFNEWRRFIPAAGAWLVLAEPQRACVALHARGAFRSVQNGKGAWLTLLERERYRMGEEAPDAVLLSGASAPEETASPLPWKFRELSAQPGA